MLSKLMFFCTIRLSIYKYRPSRLEQYTTVDVWFEQYTTVDVWLEQYTTVDVWLEQYTTVSVPITYAKAKHVSLHPISR